MFKAFLKMRRTPETASAAVSIALAFSVFTTLVAIFYIRSQKEADLGKTIYLITGDWKPYTGEGLAENGTVSAIVQAAFRRMGYRAELIFAPWTDGLDRLEASETNTEVRAAFPFRPSPQRQSRFDFSDEPLLQIESSLYYFDQASHPRDPSTLRDQLIPLPVILIDGYSYPQSYQQRADNHGSLPAANLVEAISLLLKNDPPCILLESTEVALQTIRSHFPGRTQHLRSLPFDDPQDTSSLYLLWGKGNPSNDKLKADFDQALRDLKASGDYAEIFSRVNRQLDRAWTFSIQSRQSDANIIARSQTGSFAVPSGTLVVVERWGDAFFPSADSSTAPDFNTQVRFVNGPVAGTRATIDGESVEFHSTQ